MGQHPAEGGSRSETRDDRGVSSDEPGPAGLDQAEDGYLRADVTLWPWLPCDEKASQTLALNVRDRLRHYVEMISQASGMELETNDLPDEPIELACLTAAALQVEQIEKQELLISPSIAALLAKEVGLLRRELRTLQIILASPGRPTSEESSVIFSAN